jgi:hypothetical protein
VRVGLNRFVVMGAQQTERGEVRLKLSDGYALLLFPASCKGEAWRLFAPGSDGDHLIFPAQ